MRASSRYVLVLVLVLVLVHEGGGCYADTYLDLEVLAHL
jgi:hypothetical protein